MSRGRKPTANRVLKTTANGTTYWIYPDAVAKRTERIKQQRREVREKSGIGNADQWNTIPTTANVIKLDSKTDEHYLRYVQKKKALREEYGTWVRMSREEWLEYYNRLSYMLFHDEDFLYYFKEVKKTFEEKELDDWWANKNEKDKNYDGRSDDLDWGYKSKK